MPSTTYQSANVLVVVDDATFVKRVMETQLLILSVHLFLLIPSPPYLHYPASNACFICQSNAIFSRLHVNDLSLNLP